LAVVALLTAACGGDHSDDETATPSAPSGPVVVRPLYVLPSDAVDRGLVVNGTLDRSLAAMQAWLKSQTGGPQLRIHPGTITTVRLAQTDAALAASGAYVRDRIEEGLRGLGYTDPLTVYAVWYEGTNTTACASGAWPPELIAHVAAVYLRAHYEDVDCAANSFSADGVQPEYPDYSMLHEILHTIGLVATCAPHHTRSGHTSDGEKDLMWAGDGQWQPSVLDVGHDDYYKTGRSDCADLSRSALLDPLPPDAEAPPGW
jgi:hypothetical protein